VLGRLLNSRAVARSAVIGLTVAVLTLAGLALWGTTSNERSTDHVRYLNEINDRWGQLFLNMNLEADALKRYTHDQAPEDQPVGSSVRQSRPIVEWLQQRATPVDATAVTSVEHIYKTYSTSLDQAIEADRRGDVATSDLQLEQAALALTSAQKQVTANIGRTRLETADYLGEIDRNNQRLRSQSTLVLCAGLVLLAFCGLVLFRYQRRIEHQTEEASRHLEELQAASRREAEARSESEALEVELRHAQKLESVGRLAAGIAHEINTPVQFVGDNLRFLAEAFDEMTQVLETYRKAVHEVPESSLAELRRTVSAAEDRVDLAFTLDQVPTALSQSLDGVGTVGTIVRSMKRFGHPDQTDATLTDINQALADVVVVGGSEIRGVARVETDFGSLPPVRCFAGDMNQVWLNLIVNACHAIEAAGRGEGTILIRTRDEGGDVVIEVSDTGTGIPPEVAEHVFDPFFTTKEVGRGIGQGLAVCRAIVVERHGGTLTFDTIPGEGTTFRVSLPVPSVAPGAG
jgi:signal transduction histidine kinase